MRCLWTGVFSEPEDIATGSQSLCKKLCENRLPACCVAIGHLLTPKYPTLGAFVCCLKSSCIFWMQCCLLCFDAFQPDVAKVEVKAAVLSFNNWGKGMTFGNCFGHEPTHSLASLVLSENTLQMWGVSTAQSCADNFTEIYFSKKAYKCISKSRKLNCQLLYIHIPKYSLTTME